MDGRLAGKTALITAAGQGIGHATAVAFQKEGARLWATDIDESKLAGLATLEGVTCRALDVRDASAVAAAAEEVGAVDVLFNCAGRVPHGTLLDCDPADWEETLSLNVTAVYRMIRAFLPATLAQGGGSIINMASVVSSVKAAPNRCAYGASKAAVIGLTKSVALDYAAQGIRCNAVCPGAVETPSFNERFGTSSDSSAARNAFTALHPIGRIGTPAEIAALCVHLGSDESSYTVGRTFGANHLTTGRFFSWQLLQRNGFGNSRVPGCNRNRENTHGPNRPHRCPYQGAETPQDRLRHS